MKVGIRVIAEPCVVVYNLAIFHAVHSVDRV